MLIPDRAAPHEHVGDASVRRSDHSGVAADGHRPSEKVSGRAVAGGELGFLPKRGINGDRVARAVVVHFQRNFPSTQTHAGRQFAPCPVPRLEMTVTGDMMTLRVGQPDSLSAVRQLALQIAGQIECQSQGASWAPTR